MTFDKTDPNDDRPVRKNGYHKNILRLVFAPRKSTRLHFTFSLASYINQSVNRAINQSTIIMNYHFFHSHVPPVFVFSGIMRVAILLKYGGVYCDGQVIWTNAIPEHLFKSGSKFFPLLLIFFFEQDYDILKVSFECEETKFCYYLLVPNKL